LSRAVILLEGDDLRLRKILLKVEDIPHLRPSPAIDGLVIITDGTEVSVVFNHPFDQMVLDQVGILEFIHHDITTEVLIEAQALGETFEKNRYKEEEIPEIESVISAEIALIALINLGHLLFKDVELRRNILLRSDPLVLQMVDGGSNLSRMKHLGIEVQLLDDCLEVPVLILLIIDDEIFLKTEEIDVPPEVLEQAEWKVETQIPLADPPRSFSTLSRISSAALLVKVTAKICHGGTPFSRMR
jgi:hypothetical protein